MNVLSLQGGGVLGKGQAVALRELELDGLKPLWQRFDLVGGTSVGSILGAALAVGLPMEAVNRFFDRDAPKIFRHSWRNSVLQLWGEKYDAEALEEALFKLLGSRTLGDCKTKFIATAFDADSGRNVYFQSYGNSFENELEVVVAADENSDVSLFQICRASAAAQTYFPAEPFWGMTLIDGGNTGNNAPDMLCLTEAIEMGVPVGSIKMLSIGSGRTRWPVSGMRNPCLLRPALATIKMVFAGGESNAVWQAESILGQNHYRLEADLGAGFAIDDASVKTLSDIEFAMESAIARNLNLIEPFI